MKNIIITLCLSILCNNIFAQKNCSVISSYAIATTVFPGTVMVDENGQEIPQKNTYTRKIYLITNCNITPTIKTVLYNTIKANTTLRTVKEKINIGTDNKNKKIILGPTKTTFLWEINIDLGEKIIEPAEIKTIKLEAIQNKNLLKLNLKEINIIPTFMPV